MRRVTVCKSVNTEHPELIEMLREQTELHSYTDGSKIAVAMNAGENYDLFLLDSAALYDLITARELENDRVFVLNTHGGIHSIPLSTIICVESYHRMLSVQADGMDTLYSKIVRTSFEIAIESLLEDPRFVRTRKSCVINMDKVVNVKKNSFVLKNGTEVFCPRYTFSTVKERYREYISSRGICTP